MTPKAKSSPAPVPPAPFDVIVAGGGIAGVLAAARLAVTRPELKIALLERESFLGGRARSTDGERHSYGYGLNAVSTKLFEFWDQTACAGEGEAASPATAFALEDFLGRRHARLGVLAGNRVVSAAIEEWFTPKGARTLGGLSASRQWAEVETICRKGAAADVDEDEDEGSDKDDDESTDQGAQKVARAGASAAKAHPFGHHWSQPRKAPAAVVLEHFGSAFGIPDVWSSAPSALAERAAYHSGRLYAGACDEALASLAERDWFKRSVTVFTGCRVVNAARSEGGWTVTGDAGTFTAPSLIVAQPPWQATAWLPRTEWPPHVLQIASKTKPVSVVVLSEKLLVAPADLPDVTLVPAERVQIVRNGPDEISFQATIDFEQSLSAPTVVKAVKALKRARKKLLALYPGAATESNHVALQPVAWAQSPAHADRRSQARLGQKAFNTKTLAFCGDAYGPNYDGDANLVGSVVAAVDATLG
jgi:glycine/D-amino acid oxidase-like deaminating enzyme